MLEQLLQFATNDPFTFLGLSIAAAVIWPFIDKGQLESVTIVNTRFTVPFFLVLIGAGNLLWQFQGLTGIATKLAESIFLGAAVTIFLGVIARQKGMI